MFSTFLHQTLVDDLEGDTRGDFEDLLVAMVTPPAVYDCKEVIRAIKVRLTGASRLRACRNSYTFQSGSVCKETYKKRHIKASKYQFYMFNFIKKRLILLDLFGFMPFYNIVV